MTDKFVEALKQLKAPENRRGKETAFNTQQVYEIRAAVIRGVRLIDIAKAMNVTISGLYSKMGIWAMHNLPTGEKPRATS